MKRAMTITYEYGGSLYVNTTNRCDLACELCLRKNKSSNGSIYTDNLWLEREPTREEILAAVWGKDYFGELKIVDVNIRRLRIKIEDDTANPTYITTVWGLGYKWGA